MPLGIRVGLICLFALSAAGCSEVRQLPDSTTTHDAGAFDTGTDADTVRQRSDAGDPDAGDGSVPVDDIGTLDASDDSGVAEDAGRVEPVCPHPPACSEAYAMCDGQCGVTCFPGLPQGYLTDCTRLGTCVVEASGEATTCEGGQWWDPCDETFVARCDEEVAIYCFGGVVGLVTCPSAAHCWAEGNRAGCVRTPDTCSGENGGCAGGGFNGPCCPGFECSSDRICRPANELSCAATTECAPGRACRTDEDQPVSAGEVGRCLVPSCVMYATDDQPAERCDLLPGVPCCGMSGLSCDAAMGRCCFEPGAVPLLRGVLRSDLCCSGQVGVDACL